MNTASFSYAGFWIRFLANLVDSTLISAITILFTAVAVFTLGWMREAFQSGTSQWVAIGAQIASVLFYSFFSLIYYGLGHSYYGKTLGKHFFQIQVVDQATGQFLSLRQSLIRACGYAISYLPLGCGFLMAAFHPQKKGLHDLFAGSVSIIKK